MILRHASAAARAALFIMLPVTLPAVSVLAQTAGLTAGSAYGAQGTQVTIPIEFYPGAASINMLQFDLLFSPSLSCTTVSTGPAALAADKTVLGNSTPGRTRVLVFALNQNAIGPGVIAEVQLMIAQGARAGKASAVISSIVAADAFASAVPVFGTAGGITVLPGADASPPVISALEVSEITGNSATISWTTNTPSDSEIENWAGESPVHTLTLSALATQHSLILNRLEPLTLYCFRAMSADADGNQGVTPVHCFQTTGDDTSVLALPRLALNQNQQIGNMPDEETMVGMALANRGNDPAVVTLTAIESNGSPAAGQDITNPRVSELDPGTQLALLDLDIFGDGLLQSDWDGWIKLESTTSDVDGFFLAFDTGLNFMDGANLLDSRMTDFAFMEIARDGRNKINIANGNSQDAVVTLDLVRADGTVRTSQTRVIAPNGALVADLFDDLFAGIEPDDTDYVRVRAGKGVHPFQVMQPEQGDISTLEGQDLTAGGTTLYSPHYFLGGGYKTSLSVLNLDSRDGIVQFRLIGDDGRQIGDSQYRVIQASGKLYIDDQGFFLTPRQGDMAVGYVEILSDGVRLAGSTVFGGESGHSCSAALAMVPTLHTSVVFSHVASDDLYFMGIAILNPGISGDATATLELYAADGTLLETVLEMIPAGHRKARLVSEYFSSLAGRNQISGYVRLTSDLPVASFSMFGTHQMSILSAIPPQVIR